MFWRLRATSGGGGHHGAGQRRHALLLDNHRHDGQSGYACQHPAPALLQPDDQGVHHSGTVPPRVPYLRVVALQQAAGTDMQDANAVTDAFRPFHLAQRHAAADVCSRQQQKIALNFKRGKLATRACNIKKNGLKDERSRPMQSRCCQSQSATARCPGRKSQHPHRPPHWPGQKMPR